MGGLLVGGFNPSEKYESVGMTILNIWKKNVPNHQPAIYIYSPIHQGTKNPHNSQKLIVIYHLPIFPLIVIYLWLLFYPHQTPGTSAKTWEKKQPRVHG